MPLRLVTNIFDSGSEAKISQPEKPSLDRSWRRYSEKELHLNNKADNANRGSLAMQLSPGQSVGMVGALGTLLPFIPVHVPPGFDILAHIREAQTMTVQEFYEAVRSGGRWDYKQLGKQYEEFGNWHFGVVAKAFGFPEVIARAGAGFAQMRAGTSPSGPSTNLMNIFTEPFGDDPKDQEAIGRGFKSFDLFKQSLLRAPELSKDIRLRTSEPQSDKLLLP
jgi:Bacterial toxin 44